MSARRRRLRARGGAPLAQHGVIIAQPPRRDVHLTGGGALKNHIAGKYPPFPGFWYASFWYERCSCYYIPARHEYYYLASRIKIHFSDLTGFHTTLTDELRPEGVSSSRNSSTGCHHRRKP